MLKSQEMQLSATEKSWLKWWGPTGKMKMGWACRVNRSRYPMIEQIFERIAATRVRLLQQWCDNQWQSLHSLAALFADHFSAVDSLQLQRQLKRLVDVSELFLIDTAGSVISSSHEAHVGKQDLDSRAVQAGLCAPFLHGPYVDELTKRIGPSSSAFHDAVTLMFYLPIRAQGQTVGCLCARVPNDVLGDLIQREAGHIYPESGDNYLFMVESHFDSSISPGTALSRSRFEDSTFTHGDNLRGGVHTDWGVVRIKQHTELELRFTDPATGQLHPGVRETIRHGSNLFVTYPGYSDYRHIPVIGKGVTFTLKGSPDRWGMMCEADLEEVYRYRSLGFGLMKHYLLGMAAVLAVQSSLHRYTSLPQLAIDLINVGTIALIAGWFSQVGPKRLARRMGKMTDVIRNIAEGEGNLSQRLDTQKLAADETGDMGRWVNSFIDNLDNIVSQVKRSTDNVMKNSEHMLDRNHNATETVGQVSHSIEQMLGMVGEQLNAIDTAAVTATQMKQSMEEVVKQARQQFDTVSNGTQQIRDIVQNSANSVQALDSRTAEIAGMVSLISDITSQTNLLALNAAIEAARAGEHGRGFSVVADEVRALASRTATAASEISQRIEAIREETRSAVTFMERGVEDVDRQLQLAETGVADNSHLYQSVEQMFVIIQQMSVNSKEHGRQAQQVAQATQSMGRVIRSLHASSDQVKATASRLHQLSGSFQVSKDVQRKVA
ncbi:methyl-accepting chemotaxis protein [Pokkaliibacter plantistimulans]|nr:methyl-accepting chemotaxis protein [Pokkaliibacter plantistimulans]